MCQIDLQFHNCREKKGTNKESSNDRNLRYTSEPADVFVRLSQRNWRILCPLTIFRYAEKKNRGTVKVAMLSLFCSGCSWPLCTYFTTVWQKPAETAKSVMEISIFLSDQRISRLLEKCIINKNSIKIYSF